MLKLMYITNRPDVAKIAEDNSVDRIFLDMEYIGKEKRQHGLNSVQNQHTFEDISAVRKVIIASELLVRVNPIHSEQRDGYPDTEEEIRRAINAGAEIIMLPYYKTRQEVERFLEAVGGKARTMLLLETQEAIDLIPETVSLDGVDEIHIGLNDLAISMQRSFMFDLLADGTVEQICQKLKQYHKPYGFGGLASLGRGLVPAEMILKEHYRLGSCGVILSRSFCNLNSITDVIAVREIFYRGISEIRSLEAECESHIRFFEDNLIKLQIAINSVTR